jgi:hypothetical protein
MLMEKSRAEIEYRWLDAAESYERDLDSKLEKGSSAAEYWQRIGFCYSLASRQAEDVAAFRKLRQHAAEAYEKASRFFGEDAGVANKAKNWECLSIAEYNRSWIASTPAEKRELLEKCLLFGKKAQHAFKSIGDDLNFGNICIVLALVACDLHSILQTATGKIRVIRQGLNNAMASI